ncbi:MAG: 30S ribosomal protein S6e [Thermoplasmata archaeon]
MVEFKANINEPKTGKSYQTKVTGHHANSLIGKKIGDEFDGIFVGLPGYKLVITGGSDKDGIPMREDLPGARRKKLLLSESVGFHPKLEGMRRRRLINMKITQHGSKPIEDLIKKEEKK